VGSCGHSLCRPCWQALPWPVSCPICRAYLIEPPKPNFLLNELLNTVETLRAQRFCSEDMQFAKALREEERKNAREERDLASKTRKEMRMMLVESRETTKKQQVKRKTSITPNNQQGKRNKT